MAEHDSSAGEVEPGGFPYPLTGGPTESRYLTWIRNHSNYMAERGFLDYFRLVAVLARGILLNALTLLPYLLLLSLVLGFAYKPLLADWDRQLRVADDDTPVGLFLTREVVQESGWAKSLQDWLYGKDKRLIVAGTWSAGDTLRTTLTGEDGSSRQTVVTTVRAGATTVEQVRDQHKDDLVAAGGDFDRIGWSASRVDAIVAAPVKGGNRLFISVATTAQGGRFTRSTPGTPFLVTPLVLALGVAWVLLFPIVARLSKVVGYRKTLETGTTSSVRIRDLFERSYGGLLLALLIAVLVDSLPLLVHFFHQTRGGNVAWALPTAAGATGVLVAANKLLPLLGGVRLKLAMVVVGALGLLIPLLAILFVVEFLVYADASSQYEGVLNLALILLPIAIGIFIVIAIVLGIGAFKWRAFAKLALLLAAMVALAAAIVVQIFVSDFLGEYANFMFVLAWAVEIWVFCSLAVDVNLTSISGMYRDRLASAFLVGTDTRGDVGIERDIDLQEICCYEAGSTAPYHLVNVALNLQGSKDISIRERSSDFFIFSKRFIGGERTGYCRTENLEQVYPQIDLGMAMAISAAAAAPNMGRGTNPLMVAFLTLLNARLGSWIPNPGRLEAHLAGEQRPADGPGGFDFARDVFPAELDEISQRRRQAGQSASVRPLDDRQYPTTAHNLVGLGLSGGGIRSATINLGIVQALHGRGIFDHVDYLSTVSGGGYLGSSISTLMRHRTRPASEIAGTVSIDSTHPGEKCVRISGPTPTEVREYRYSGDADLAVEDGAVVEAGQRLLRRRAGSGEVSLMERFQWRVRPGALWREMLSWLDETHNWVNLSDGGHIENLASIELLRRRCKYIIIGDGEADPDLHFNGLATLIRYARIDLGIRIEIDLDAIRLDRSEATAERDKGHLSREHHAVGTIDYPAEPKKGLPQERGTLLYLKSSFSGDEDEVITEYRHRNPRFPHESTADQFFDENQFEAYRALGQHIAEQALAVAPAGRADAQLSFRGLEEWFTALAQRSPAPTADSEATP